MIDLISRQAAINILRKHEKSLIQRYANKMTDKDSRERGIVDGIAFAIEDLDVLPSAQLGWIPVTERLPKKDGDYLVTTHSGQIARYIFIGGSSEEYWRRCATAWMPLPEPYKEKQDE